MPVVISSNKLYVKKEDGSGYLPANVIAAETTEEQIERLEDAGDDQVDRVENKASEIVSQLTTAAEVRDVVADAFSTSKNYAVGDYCFHEDANNVNKLYKFTIAHPAGNWIGPTGTGADVAKVKLANDTSDLKSALRESEIGAIKVPYEVSSVNIVSGTLNASGAGTNNTKRSRTDFIQFPVNGTYIARLSNPSYKFTGEGWAYTTNAASGHTKLIPTTGTDVAFISFDTTENYIRLVFSCADDTQTMTDADRTAIASALTFWRYTDRNLNVTGVPADSKAVGTRLLAIESNVSGLTVTVDDINKRFIQIGGELPFAGATLHDGYYYNSSGEKVYNSDYVTIEDIPYDPTKAWEFNYKPVICAFNSEDGIQKYHTGASSQNGYFLPVWYNVVKFHLSYKKSVPFKAVTRPLFVSRWYGLTCAIYGDSIAKGLYASGMYVDHPFIVFAAMANGMTVTANHSIGGAAYSTGGDAASTLWVDQMDSGNIPNNEADLIVVSAGTNDWGHSSPLGQLGDNDVSTFYGAVTKTLTQIKYKNGKAKVLCILPLDRGSGTAIENAVRKNSANCSMLDYTQAIINVCNALDVPYVTANELYINPFLTSSAFYTDHLHPIEPGHIIMGASLAERISRIMPKDGATMAR